MKQLKIRKDIKKAEPNQPMSLKKSLKMKTNLKAGQGVMQPTPEEKLLGGILPIYGYEIP